MSKDLYQVMADRFGITRAEAKARYMGLHYTKQRPAWFDALVEECRPLAFHVPGSNAANKTAGDPWTVAFNWGEHDGTRDDGDAQDPDWDEVQRFHKAQYADKRAAIRAASC